MKKLNKTLAESVLLFLIGGLLYYLIEILFRGRSHFSMILCGGMCFLAIGLINERLSWDTPLWKQMLIGAALVTILEFFTGCIVNRLLHLNVWDYSSIPGNILGQICPPFTLLWFFISLPALLLDDYIRYRFFHEEKPRYKLI